VRPGCHYVTGRQPVHDRPNVIVMLCDAYSPGGVMLTIRIPQTREIEIETFFDDHDLLRRALGESSIGWVCP